TAAGDSFGIDSQATVWPIPLTLTTDKSLMLVGNGPPPLIGSVNGTTFTGATTYTTTFGDSVNVTLRTGASAASPTGQYLIAAVLSGPDAGNYFINPATSS